MSPRPHEHEFSGVRTPKISEWLSCRRLGSFRFPRPKVPDGGPSEDGRRGLVGAAVGDRRCETEEDVGGDPEEPEGEDRPDNSVADCPEML